ncbi:hypothetical protein E1A91_D02G259200v1 [Gossypium mustelinum]|uniref:Uncharacterized protein n=2 Tax=Gossypium TaxID=3633 RepID=A0A5D2W0T6_GOSMU|nr:hypothetical protein E1A91_D02G259200v1 [Gossypium mustelinum]
MEKKKTLRFTPEGSRGPDCSVECFFPLICCMDMNHMIIFLRIVEQSDIKSVMSTRFFFF